MCESREHLFPFPQDAVTVGTGFLTPIGEEATAQPALEGSKSCVDPFEASLEYHHYCRLSVEGLQKAAATDGTTLLHVADWLPRIRYTRRCSTVCVSVSKLQHEIVS